MSVISPVKWEEYSALWNELFPMKQVGKANAWRRGMLMARSADDDWRESWRDVLVRASKCQQLVIAGWFSADWLLKDKDGYSTRILEGEFDDSRQHGFQRGSRSNARSGGPTSATGDFDAF